MDFAARKMCPVLPLQSDYDMNELLYKEIIRIADSRHTWMAIVSTGTYRTCIIIRNGKITGIVCRTLVVKAIRTRRNFREGDTRHIAEYELEQAVKTLRRADSAFKERTHHADLTPEDVERIILAATHGVINPELNK